MHDDHYRRPPTLLIISERNATVFLEFLRYTNTDTLIPQSPITPAVSFKTMNSFQSEKLLAASSGDAVKLFDFSMDAQNQCVLTYSPSPGLSVNSVKWNHNNMVLASAGDDGSVSLWKKNGQSLWNLPTKNGWGGMIEPSESISTINFGNKGSRYLCSGGTGQVVRIWDLQNKRCVKWLKGHTDAITGVMYNCKDEHIASVSRKGDLIVHNLASGSRAAELKDPDGQVLVGLDYSRMSRHLLVTAGDDGSVHLWDTTGRSPKISWMKQHSAPTSGVGFSPSNDKSIASVGLDMKLYIFDTGSRRPSSCISYEVPFSSLAFADDRVTIAAGTTTGQVVLYDIRGRPQPLTILRAYSKVIKSLCWKRSKLVAFDENNYTDETILLAGDVGDSILMPDPLPSRSSSSHFMSKFVSASHPSHEGSTGSKLSLSGRSGSTASAKSPRSSLLKGLTLARLHEPQGQNVKDDMDVFSPLVEVQPLTPSALDKLWGDFDGSKKEHDTNVFPSQRYGLPDERGNIDHLIFPWKPNSESKQDDSQSTFSQLTSNFASTHTVNTTSVAPPKTWVGERFLDKFVHRESVKRPSRFAMSTASSSTSKSLLPEFQGSLPTGQSTSTLTSDLKLTNLCSKEASHQEIPSKSSEADLSPIRNKSIISQSLIPSSSPKRFSSYAERIGATPSMNEASTLSVGSPKSKKSGLGSREELLNSLLGKASSLPAGSPKSKKTGLETGEEHLISLWAKSQPVTGTGVTTSKLQVQSESQQGTFTLQPSQHNLEEILASFQDSVHGDIRNLHLEILRQFHMHEMEMSSVMRLILENQAEIMKEIRSLGEETQLLHQLL